MRLFLCTLKWTQKMIFSYHRDIDKFTLQLYKFDFGSRDGVQKLIMMVNNFITNSTLKNFEMQLV